MSTRRNFVKQASILGAGIALAPKLAFGSDLNFNKSKLNIALIGVGLRGTNHLTNLLLRNDCNIIAICDIDNRRIKIAQDLIVKHGQKKAQVFGKDDYDYRNLLQLSEVEAVIISTPWLWHTKMAKDSMKAGKYTGVEVSASNTMEECWDLVNVHEETGSHLMILENVNYRREFWRFLIW